PGLYDARWNRLQLVELLLEAADQLQSHALHRQAGHQREAAIGSLLAEEYTKSFGIAFDLVEEQRRNSPGALPINHLCHGTDLQVPIGAVNTLELAHGFNKLEPLPHIFIPPGHIAFVQRLVFFRKGHHFSFDSLSCSRSFSADSGRSLMRTPVKRATA